ncbi:MAG TPA: hypothetical protein PLP17_15565, partial [Oligoflexia bacterium]|nr:hypothetical protein [Oligoflexia bacterium]
YIQEHAAQLRPQDGSDETKLQNERRKFEQHFGIDFAGSEWDIVLDPAKWAWLEDTVLKIAGPILSRGVISNKSQLRTILKNDQQAVLLTSSKRIEKELSAERQLYGAKEALESAKAAFPANGMGQNPVLDSVVEKLIAAELKPNVFYNLEETESRIKKAQQSVEPIYYRIKRNEVIVRAGDVITAVEERRLRQLQEELRSGGLLYTWLGYLVLSALVLLSVYALAEKVWPEIQFSARDLFVGSLTLVGSFFLIKLFSIVADSLSNSFFYFDPGTFLLAAPLAAGGILLQVTIGSAGVFVFVLSFALLSGIFLANSWIVIVLIVCGNIVGSLAVHDCSRRSAFIRAGIRVAAVNMLAVLCFLFIFPEYTTAEAANRVLWALVGGLVSGVLAAGLTPVRLNVVVQRGVN